MSEGQEQVSKPRIVEFKGEQGKIQQVNLSNLEVIFANMQAHNDEFSLGAMLAKGLSSHIRDEGDENSEGLKPFSAEKDKGDVLSETLEILHADSLSPIGISFTTSEVGATLMTGDEQIAQTQLEFGIQNPDLFLSFLDGLTQQKDLNREAISEMLNKVGLDTALQIWRNYRSIGDSRNERIELIAGRLEELVSKFKGLGVKTRWDDRKINLEDYAKYAEKGILKEYIASEDSMLFNKPEKQKEGNYPMWFNHGCLSAWWGDIGTSTVQHRWERAFVVLEHLKSNPKAKELLQEVKTNLADCVRAALQDIDSKDENWDKENEGNERKEKKEIFENARIHLQLM